MKEKLSKCKICAQENGTVIAKSYMPGDMESAYAPKDMQTLANKNKKSIKGKLLLPEDSELKPGREAKVVL